jgi:hypothetical protein
MPPLPPLLRPPLTPLALEAKGDASWLTGMLPML